jgi:hypothetical protein
MEQLAAIDPVIALGVVAATALTDAVCVLYTSSVARRRDLAAANWGSLTYMLSAFAVISFTSNWVYVVFAAVGAWIGCYASMKILRWRVPHGGAHDEAEPASRSDPVIAAPLTHLTPAATCQPPPPSEVRSDGRKNARTDGRIAA